MSARGEDGRVVAARPAFTANTTLSITQPEGEEVFGDEWAVRHDLEIWHAHVPLKAPAQQEQ
jgi:hypothetical protein